MKKNPTNVPDCTIFLLAKAYQKGHGLIKKRLKKYGLTNMQHLVLEGLWYQGGITAADLGKLLILDKATLSGILDRMGDGGWIEKRPDPDDKRIQHLYPSEKANDAKDNLVLERQKANDELLTVLSPEEKFLLKRILLDLM